MINLQTLEQSFNYIISIAERDMFINAGRQAGVSLQGWHRDRGITVSNLLIKERYCIKNRLKKEQYYTTFVHAASQFAFEHFLHQIYVISYME
jgi:hypothetical protein